MIEVVAYDERWPEHFERLRDRIAPALGDIVLAIEHVGSTSVPGLWAKPVIDIDVIVAAKNVPLAIERLATIGYSHQGDLGVPGREAFKRVTPSSSRGEVNHHLYVCVEGCLSLRNHLAVRDYLRVHDEKALQYGALKRWLAEKHSNDVDAYVEGKSALLAEVLLAGGLSKAEVVEIGGVNRR